MKFSWRGLLAATAALVLAIACVNCGGGTTGSTLGGERRERLGRQWRISGVAADQAVPAPAGTVKALAAR